MASVAVVGCGTWGMNLVRNFARLGVLDYACDLSETKCRSALTHAPGCVLFSHPDEVWDSSATGVVIATPAETHYALTKEALLANKNVLCEKPLALTWSEGAELVDLAERQERILMVGHVLEYHPAITRLRQLIAAGELGRVYYIYSNRLSLGKVRREENILWSFAPHDIAIILRLVGEMPIQVVASGGSYLQPKIVDVTITHLLFENNVRAHIHVSWLHPFKEQRLVVIGSRKMASFDDISKKLLLYDQRVEVTDLETVHIQGKGEEVPYSNDEPLFLECQAFLSAIQSRRQPLTNGVSALRVLEVLQAAQRSLASDGQPVGLNKEEVIP